jgi:capsular exopolysaccharide synthesis family protein
MDVRDFSRTISQHRLAFFLVLGIFVVGGAAAAFLRPNHYEATATIVGVPANGQTDFNSVSAVQFLLPTVVKDVSTVTFRNLVRQSLPSGTTLQGVSIGAALEQGTGILDVTASSKDRQAVVPVANTAALALVRHQLTPALELKVLDPAHGVKNTATRLRAPILVSAFALGLIFAVFSTLIRDSFDRRLRSPEEIYERLGLEILGEIPSLRKFPSTPAALFGSPDSARIAEAYQRLVANLEVALAPGGVRTIAITSAASNEGKTTVTTCLAWVLALLGHNVVAIDGDLRKPNVHRRLEVDSTQGLANAQNGNVASLERRTKLKSLSVIPAGQGIKHPAQVVTHELPEVLSAVSDRMVLIDTPPILAAAEAMLIAMLAKNVILVIDRKGHAYEDIERVLHELRRAKAEVLGVVVNRAKVRRSAAGYDDYYVPIQQPAPPPPRPAQQPLIRRKRPPHAGSRR